MSAWTLAGATVVDGTGAEPRTANVVIEDDRIASVEGNERRGTVIDATGLVAAPGFVDIHSHVDWIAPLADGPELLAPNLLQGITTAVSGNCGVSPAPLGDVFQRGAIERMPVVGLGLGPDRLGLADARRSTCARSSSGACRLTWRCSSATARSGRRCSATHDAPRPRASSGR